MGVVTHPGDAVKWARGYEGPLFHALFCDAPYEMEFMGKDWDRSGVAFDPETWKAFARVLYPGAFLFVFAGTINDDLISVAMREAGLRKFHKMMGWAYGSGFPKASRIDTQVDKINGRDFNERYALGRYIRERRKASGYSSKDINLWFGYVEGVQHWESQDSRLSRVPNPRDYEIIKDRLGLDDRFDYLIDRYGAEREIVGKDRSGKNAIMGGLQGVENGGEYDLTLPATPLARAWEGHRYGLQALKPAIETILVFQKPYDGKPIDNITETGAGALNIDGGRIGTEGDDYHDKQGRPGGVKPGNGRTMEGSERFHNPLTHAEPNSSGRWPSNFLLLDEAAARALDEQSGDIKTKRQEKPVMCDEESNTWGGTFQRKRGARGYSDSGGASRFFFRVSDQIDEADPVFYCAKASRGERDAGLGDTGLKESAQRYGLTGSLEETGHGPHKHYKARNPHPTVKPISLTQHLATLLLPPPEYAPRRIFIPFAGVGSEQIGAVLAGWEEVEGVELTEEYIPINRARLEYWQNRPKGSKKPKNNIPPNVKNSNQLELI